MSIPFEDMFNKLQYSSSVKAKQILRDLEGDPTELVQFCRQARRLSPVRASALAHMLYGMTNPEFLLLLKDYVLDNDEGVSEAAFSVLSRCNNSARKEMMFELLEAPGKEIRKKACEVLGESLKGGDDRDIEKHLLKMLDDEFAEVIITALKMLAGSKENSVIRKSEELLAHKNSDIRFLALGIVANSEEKNFPVAKVADILLYDEDDNNIVEACRLLAKKVPEKGRPYFVELLENTENSNIIRQQAVLAIAQVKNKDVAKILFDMISHNDNSVGVMMECKKALGKFEPETVVKMCSHFFSSASVQEKLEYVSVLGSFSSSITQDFLFAELYKDHNQIVLAAILEQLSKLGVLDVWEFAEKAVYDKENIILAYAAVQALSELLTPDRLDSFAGVLQAEPPVIIVEAILKRLYVFGRDRGLNVRFAKIVFPYLNSEYENIVFFAFKTAGHIAEAALVVEMLKLVDQYVGTEMMDVLVRCIMQGVDGSLHSLLVLSGDLYLRNLTAVLSRLDRDCAVEDLSDFFGYLARKAEAEVRGAQTCLTIGATLLSEDYVKSFLKVGEKELAFMLYTWSTLPHDMRVHTKIDWPMILANPKLAVRVAALRAMTDSDIENNIADVADIAFSDPKEEARQAAVFVLRELFIND